MKSESVNNQQPVITNYTYAGLLPFFASALGPWVFADYTQHFAAFFIFYAAIILVFLAGALWGIALYSDISLRARHLHTAIFFSLLPLLAYFLPHTIGIGLMLLGFLLLLFWEKCFVNNIYPQWYQTLRHKVTFIVVACHMLMLLTLIRH
jgi:hypothetical protein